MRWLFAVVVALLLSQAVRLLLEKRIDKQREDIVDLDVQVTRMQLIVDEARALENHRRQLRETLAPFERIEATRHGAHCFLASLDRVLRETDGEFHGVSESGGLAELRITTRDDAGISTFMRRLHEAPGLSDVSMRFNIPESAWEYSFPGRYGARISMRVDYTKTCGEG